METDRSLVVLSRRECLALLQAQQIGRVVFTEGALPAVMPVSYAVLDDAVFVATRTGSRLAVAARGGVLAFEVDHLDPATRSGWSVVVTAFPEFVTLPVEQSRALSVLDSWVPGRNELILRLPLTVVSGRRILADPPPVAAIG